MHSQALSRFSRELQQGHGRGLMCKVCHFCTPHTSMASGLHEGCALLQDKWCCPKPVLPQELFGNCWAVELEVMLVTRLSTRITWVTPVYTGNGYGAFPPFNLLRLLRGISQKCSCSAVSLSKSLCNITATEGIKL